MGDAPPAMVTVETYLDGVHITLPGRISGRVRDHRRLQAAVVLAALAAAGLALGAVPVVQAGGNIALVAAMVFVASLVPYGLLLVGQQRLTVARRVLLRGSQLCVEGHTLPLETISAVTVARDQLRGRLLLRTPEDTFTVLDGLLVGELSWLASLIEAHAARCRAGVGEGERDAQVPAALTALVAQADRSPGA